MGPDVRMDFDDVREMAAILKQAAQGLEQMSAVARRWSAQLKEGVLLGEAGEVLADAFEGTLSPRVLALSEKTVEMERDLLAAIDTFKAAVIESKERFG